MANFKEIVTKAVIGKGKKTFLEERQTKVDKKVSTILGCWIINHKFSGKSLNDRITINGEYDVNIWYSYDDDTKTDVIKEHNTYQETVKIKNNDETDIVNEEIIVRSLKQPSCTKLEIKDSGINYSVEKELGIELVGDTKVKIAIDEAEDPWDEIIDEKDLQTVEEQINEEVKEEVVEDLNVN